MDALPASEMEMTLPRSSPDNCAYCSARFLASLKCARAGVLDQLRIIPDRVADRIDPGGVAAGADNDGQHL